MKGIWSGLLALAALAAVFVACGIVWAAEGEAKGEEPKATEEAQPEPTAEAVQAVIEKRLKALQVALEAVTKERRGRIPGRITDLAKSLAEKDKGLLNPETKKQFVMNAAMANKPESDIENPKTFITFYADAPTPNKGRAVIYADSTLKYLKEEEFKKALEASKTRELSMEERRDRRDEALSRRGR